jgi:GDP-4-dehydro-6-deoxy-D-mannose reductase
LAGQADVGRSWDDPVETLRANVEGTMNVLAAARAAGVDRVLTVTSADVYGAVDAGDLPVSEEAPMRPVSPYAASKAAADLVALQAHLGHGQDVVRARSFNHLGRRQSDRFVCPALAARIVANERSGGDVVPVGNLKARRDFTDVRDVVRAYRMLAIAGQAGVAYNVCSGRAVAIAEVAERFLSMATHPMRLETDSALLRPVDVPELRGDPSRLQTATGWVPTHDLDDTLAEVLDDWRGRLGGHLTAD